MKRAETVTFGGSALDRAGDLRADAATQEALWHQPGARVLPIWRGKPLCRTGATGDDLVWLPPDHPIMAGAGVRVLLGFEGAQTGDGARGAARFAIDLSAWEPEAMPDHLDAFLDTSRQNHPDLPATQAFAELRGIMCALTPRAAELAATAKAVLGWHVSHRFCARCGVETVPAMGGWQRNCPACRAHHFPRTDPVVIMLITRGNSVLLGRSPGWPERMFSLLAGFIEPGETMEAAVRREVFEEAGIHVGEVGYLASQPWAFPASLMLGCRGVALDDAITVDPTEIEEALWVSREDMVQVFADEDPRIRPPRKGAIAGFLLEHWVADRLD
ncbi:NAD(+) diphosphatase [Oceaniglobus indicus]|uniref:NAD(+) diphosphatase n=1 Tax=Oceaniglobus indicus TaxID=2047749 RepID=UPI000C19EAB1|nr:NAD(+) diphosphatase [Oceaniglobus indicus]